MSRAACLLMLLDNMHASVIRERKNMRRRARYSLTAFTMTETEFKLNYRITQEMFLELCEILEPHMKNPRNRSGISIQYKILAALSFFASGSYQRVVGGAHGILMSQQSVSKAIREVTDALNAKEVLSKYIVFPQNRQEREILKTKFYANFGIPGVLGCIDGTHVAIVRPAVNEERYFNNRKNCHSRNVQIICDADLNIISVDASHGGATHDSFIWSHHPIMNHMITLARQGEKTCLLGDSGYAQREYMMTPIINAAVGSPEEYYTNKHSSARSTVERTIGLLKARWRCLLKHRVLHYQPRTAGKIINACCVLHNMCNKKNIATDLTYQEDESTEPSQPPASSFTLVPELNRGIRARERLVNQLWNSRYND